MGTNARAKSNRSRSIGWQPKKTTKDFLATIKEEVEEIIRTNYKLTNEVRMGEYHVAS